MKREPRKQWSGVLVRDGKPVKGGAVEGSTLETLIESAKSTAGPWLPASKSVTLESVKCRCLECDDGGGVPKEVRGIAVRINCPACKGKKEFADFDPINLSPKRGGGKSVFVRVASHRGRDRLFRLTGRMQGYWSMERSCTGGFYLIPAGLLEKARGIKGVTLVSDPTDLHKCWS